MPPVPRQRLQICRWLHHHPLLDFFRNFLIAEVDQEGEAYCASPRYEGEQDANSGRVSRGRGVPEQVDSDLFENASEKEGFRTPVWAGGEIGREMVKTNSEQKRLSATRGGGRASSEVSSTGDSNRRHHHLGCGESLGGAGLWPKPKASVLGKENRVRCTTRRGRQRVRLLAGRRTSKMSVSSLTGARWRVAGIIATRHEQLRISRRSCGLRSEIEKDDPYAKRGGWTPGRRMKVLRTEFGLTMSCPSRADAALSGVWPAWRW